MQNGAAAEILLSSPRRWSASLFSARHFNQAHRSNTAVGITKGAQLMLKQSFFVVVYPARLNSAFRLALSCLTLFALFSTSFAQTVNTTSKPQLVPNARRYKESGLKPATGRSGSASLTGRALLGKDGATTIELSTGHAHTARHALWNQHFA